MEPPLPPDDPRRRELAPDPDALSDPTPSDGPAPVPGAEPDAAWERAGAPTPLPPPPAPPPPPARDADERKRRPPPLGPAARIIAVALLVGAGALAGLLLTRGDRPEAPRDALEVVQAAVQDLSLEFETDEPVQAVRFISDAYGRRVAAPELRGYALLGVAPAALDADATTPAFVYEGPDGPFGVAALDYALLDAAGERLAFGPELRGLLADDGRTFLREAGTATAVLWRDRDDVFVAFPTAPQAVADAVVLPQR